MSDLIAKLEAATIGSPAFDLEIMKLVGWTRDEVNNPVPMWRAPDTVPYGMSPAVSAMTHEYPYTRSLDAALTLVPDGWALDHLCDHWHVTDRLRTSGDATCKLVTGGDGVVLPKIRAAGASKPLAICIAALKARTASEVS